MKNITSVATDEAPETVIGHHRGFVSLLKGKVPSVLSIHCVLHRHHPVAKNLSSELYAILEVCVK